ncbi:hypothetical protein FC56_GL000264 [Lentilactobacillus senioris DSM 24302 = JCM 17472]|uniref:Uncharacterized protein n=1 Tax=Lentilactobacillus senioris DSM 24302 = JCM 17472 TaxID=1423802 RepID=A0A0R2CP46_9LACO|nr:hypothetical protein [Lentilactobacillus senioris]KRM93551.1 hypothetical protein FC56_GL000264 [Lentilactobacillus senioris DSM 24302 = JCM 17472]
MDKSKAAQELLNTLNDGAKQLPETVKMFVHQYQIWGIVQSVIAGIILLAIIIILVLMAIKVSKDEFFDWEEFAISGCIAFIPIVIDFIWLMVSLYEATVPELSLIQSILG